MPKIFFFFSSLLLATPFFLLFDGGDLGGQKVPATVAEGRSVLLMRRWGGSSMFESKTKNEALARFLTDGKKTLSSFHPHKKNKNSPTFQRFAVRSNAMAQELAKKSEWLEREIEIRIPPCFLSKVSQTRARSPQNFPNNNNKKKTLVSLSSSSGAAQQAELSKTATSFAETFKQEVKKGLDEVAKTQQQPPKGGG